MLLQCSSYHHLLYAFIRNLNSWLTLKIAVWLRINCCVLRERLSTKRNTSLSLQTKQHQPSSFHTFINQKCSNYIFSQKLNNSLDIIWYCIVVCIVFPYWWNRKELLQFSYLIMTKENLPHSTAHLIRKELQHQQ